MGWLILSGSLAQCVRVELGPIGLAYRVNRYSRGKRAFVLSLQPHMAEAKLLRACELYLLSSTFNPFGGSMASERLQNLLVRYHPDVYGAALPYRKGKAWIRFLQRYD